MMCGECKIGSVGLQGLPTIRARIGNELSNAIPTELVVAVKYLQVPSVAANGADETSSLENVLGRESVSALCGKQIRSGRDGVILQTRLSALATIAATAARASASRWRRSNS